MRAFVYGFKPFRHYSHNITEAVVQALPARRGLTRHVFDVRFDRAQFVDAVKKAHPDVVLGLGMHGRARKIRVERRAVNKQRADDGTPPRPIRRGGPPALFATLDVPTTPSTTVTYNAGTYVCNFSMYVLLEYCQLEAIPYAFLHVPPRIPTAPVTRVIAKILRSAEEQMS